MFPIFAGLFFSSTTAADCSDINDRYAFASMPCFFLPFLRFHSAFSSLFELYDNIPAIFWEARRFKWELWRLNSNYKHFCYHSINKVCNFYYEIFMIRIWLLMKHLPKIFKNESNYKKSLNIQHSKQKFSLKVGPQKRLWKMIWPDASFSSTASSPLKFGLFCPSILVRPGVRKSVRSVVSAVRCPFIVCASLPFWH